MTAAVWLVLVEVASFVFNDWLIERENPNRGFHTYVRTDGVREVVLARN